MKQTHLFKTIRKQKGVAMMEYAVIIAGIVALALLIFATDGMIATSISNTINNAVTG